MLQKFVIVYRKAKDQLKIREYSVIEKNLSHTPAGLLRDEDFVFMCAEKYSVSAIGKVMEGGLIPLVAALRTRNLFPIEAYAQKIAASVMALYQAVGDHEVELILDDRDLLDAGAFPSA